MVMFNAWYDMNTFIQGTFNFILFMLAFSILLILDGWMKKSMEEIWTGFVGFASKE